MAKPAKEARFDVSVYLLRSDQVHVAEGALFPNGVSPIPLRIDIPGGRFLPLPVNAGVPKWVAYIEPLLEPGSQPNLLSQMPGGLLWVPRGKKCFVFAFGYAHMKLNDDWLEPEFGKKVALSVIPQGQVVEVRAEQVFAKGHIASERAPRASAVREFGFEADRDLVSAVEGVPGKSYLEMLGMKVRGGTAFRFGMKLSELLAALDILTERFDSDAYKKSWPQVDNLMAVRDAAKITSLNVELDKIFLMPKPGEKLSLAAPALRSGDKPFPQHYVIGRKTKGVASAPYLLYGNWEAYLRGEGRVTSVASAVDTPIHFLDEDKSEIDSGNLYQCIGAEVGLNAQPFILSSGVWYEAKRQFVRDTNQLISTISAPPYKLPSWSAPEDEGAYNVRATNLDTSLWLFDKELVSFGGGHSRFEFCDLMHLKTKTLYFVKHPSGSASVSHLSEQTRRTVENFFSMDGSFRKKLKEKILRAGKIKDVSWLKNRPQRQDWNLCLVSMGKPATKFPFFAKCGVARLVRELEQGGYNVSFQDV